MLNITQLNTELLFNSHKTITDYDIIGYCHKIVSLNKEILLIGLIIYLVIIIIELFDIKNKLFKVMKELKSSLFYVFGFGFLIEYVIYSLQNNYRNIFIVVNVMFVLVMFRIGFIIFEKIRKSKHLYS